MIVLLCIYFYVGIYCQNEDVYHNYYDKTFEGYIKFYSSCSIRTYVHISGQVHISRQLIYCSLKSIIANSGGVCVTNRPQSGPGDV